MDHFNAILEALYKKSPFQKKKIEKYLSTKDEKFRSQAEEFARQYTGYLKSQNTPIDFAVEAYQKLCNDMMKCQVSFMKTGKYPIVSSEEANSTIYSNENTMRLYMIGLAISQFLWSSHYDIYNCLLNSLEKNKTTISKYLEIGPGHGLFLTKAVEIIGESAEYTAVDISKTSLEITKSIINYFMPNQQRIKYHYIDMLQLDLNEKFDYITMGEVLEHVNKPEVLLNKLKDLLSPIGRAFVSTCVDCPAIDHVYHFKSVQEIRDMFTKCGFTIEDERIAPVEDLPMEEIVKKKITINYCGILIKS